MSTIIVSRHSGAVDWLREECLVPDDARVVDDFDTQAVRAGDLVIGTLPAQLAAAICERGARYQHLTLDLSPELRGVELSAAQMRECKARLEEFFIQRATVAAGKTRQTALLCIVSDQTLQNLIPARLDRYKPDHIHLLESATMKARGATQQLKHAFEVAGCRRISVVDGCPDHDLPQIIGWGHALIRRLRSEQPQTRFVVNLTGGNKLMSMGLLQALRPWCEAIYCDTEHQRVEIVHPPGEAALALPTDLLNVKTYLAAQGFTTRPAETDGPTLEKRRALTTWLAENAAGLSGFFRNLNYAAAHWDGDRRDAGSPRLRAVAAGLETAACQRLLEAGVLEKTGSELSVVKGHAAYVKGGWLEEYCHAIGRELESPDIDSAHRLTRARFAINVQIDPIEQARTSKYPLNELDAVFVHRSRMLIVECKTGTQFNDDGRSQTILNKLEVLGEHAAGRFASKMVLTTETAINATAGERARRYGIRILTAGELKHLKQHIIDWMDR